MLRGAVLLGRAVALATALMLPLGLAGSTPAIAAPAGRALAHERSAVQPAVSHARNLATRRTLVRRATSVGAERQKSKAEEAGRRARNRAITPAQTRALGSTERVKSAAAKSTAADSGLLDDMTLTGPSGLVSYECFKLCGLDPGRQWGNVFAGEHLTVSSWVSDTNGSGQVQVTWTETCGSGSYGTVGSETVSAGSTVSASFAVTSACEGPYEPGETNFAVTGTVTPADGGSGSVPLDAYWGSEPFIQIIGCPGSPNSAGAYPLAQGACGDPVDTASGAFADSYTDATLKSAGYPLAVTRSYSSANPASGTMGTGWSLPWQAGLSVDSSTGNATFTAEDGDQYLYSSDGAGHFTAPFGARSVLTESTNSSGAVTGYELTAPDNHVLDFNASGQVTAENDATGRGLSFSYNGAGQAVSIGDAAGQEISLSYTGGLLTQISLPNGHGISYSYTGDQLTSVTDPDGNSTRYTYSPAGLLASVKDPDGNDTIRNTYNSSGQVTAQEDGAGNSTAYSYTTTSGGLPETDVANPNGGLTSDVYGGGMLLESVNPDNGTTGYVYNAYGQPEQLTDPLGNVTKLTYDSAGDLLSQTDPLGDLDSWTYDPSGNVLTATDADENVTTYTYNAMDEVTSKTTPSGGKTTYTYDSSGNLVSSVSPPGNVSSGNPAAYTTTYASNSAGQLTSVTNPARDKTSYTYDSEGYPQTVTDPLGHTTTYGYDNDERETSVTGPDGGVTRSDYDGAGNLTSTTDPDDNAYTYGYDADNRVIKATDALGNSVTYGYDAVGNQTSFTDARGISTTTAFNPDDKPVKITYSDGTPSVSYTYDADDQITGITDATGSRTLSYNAAGEMTVVSGPGTGSFGYAYDGAGNVTSRAYPDGTKATYTYDSDGQIASLTSGSAVTSYTYDPAGNLISTTAPNGVDESRSYDAAGQLTGITEAKSGATVDSYGLTLNADGQPSQATVVSDGTAQATRYYGYDSTGRLASACYSSSGSSACSAASAGTATVTAPNPAAPGAPSGAVTNGIAGKCLDDSGNSTTAGGKVDIYSCSGGAAQVWTVQSDGTIRINGQCLDVKGQGTANGTLVDHYTCGGQANQQWKVGSSHSLVNPVSGMCLSDPDASTTDGTQLIIANCNGQPQQQWLLPSSALAPAGPLSSGLSGKCLDDSGGSSSNGNKIDIYSCNGQASQNWTVESDGTVRIMGKCLDVKGQGTANSTLVDLYTCAGQGNQVWEPTPNGFLVNPASDKCLDDPGSSTTNGTQLNIYTCVAGASNEVWTLPSTTVPAVPTGVQVTAGAAAATVSWTRPSATGGSALTGFTVTASPGGATAMVGPYTTTATMAGLTAGTAYTFTVTASNGVGSSVTSATSAVTPGSETAYGYDKAGNVTSTTADGLTTASSYNADEELTKAVTGSATVSYGYNADGDLTAAGDQSYAYNGADELSQAVTPNGTFTYGYDAGGNLSTTDLNGSLLQGTVWDENGPLAMAAEETSGSGATENDYLYGPTGALASLITPTATYSATTDWLGSVTGLFNSSGTQVTAASYNPYGTPSLTDLASGAPASSVGYAGSYLVPGGTGLDDMRARNYDPATEAFTSPDPLVSLTGQPYAYASDTPASETDPSGAITCPSWVPGCGVVTDVQNVGSRLARDYWQYEWVDNPCSPAYNPQAAAMAGLTGNVAKLAKRFGVSQQEMREAIHNVKRLGSWRGGQYRNPDIVVDDDGEVYPLGPGGEPAEDSIGNILDFLGDF